MHGVDGGKIGVMSAGELGEVGAESYIDKVNSNVDRLGYYFSSIPKPSESHQVLPGFNYPV